MKVKFKKNKTVFISGNFNILHSGHLRLFNFAKRLGDKLIVGILSDKATNFSYISEKERLEAVKLCLLVDEIILIKKSLNDELKKIKPDIVVKGKEHEKLFNQEQEYLDKIGSKIIFHSGDSFNSLDLFLKDFNSKNTLENKNIGLKKPIKFIERHKIDTNYLKNIIKNFKKLNVCVIGDIIVDEYIHCETLGMSNEEPTLAVSPLNSKMFIGGAAIVAAHGSTLNAKVDLHSVIGNDNTATYVKDELKKLKLDSNIIVDDSRITNLKKRYRAKDRTLLKVSHLDQSSISLENQKKIYDNVKKNIKKYNLIIFSDFNYGCLTQSLINKISKLAKKYKIIMAADSQSSSQIGDISRFKSMDIITPTEKEARISIKNHEDGIVVITEKLLKESASKIIILKLGEEGIFIHSGKNNRKKLFTDKLEALNDNPKDSSGAGDSMLIGASLCLASNCTVWQSALIGSIMSAIQISRIGNVPITSNQLLNEIF